MTWLVLRSLRHRPAAATATFLSALLGTALIGSFAALAESARTAHGDDRETLVIMGAVVGGWGALIVLYAVASTVGITATQRVRETGLLRTVGASRRQVRRLITGEALAVSLAAALPGALVAAGTGRLLFDTLRDGGVLSAPTTYGGSVLSLAATVLLVVVAARLAAAIAARRATRGSAVAALRDADLEPRRMPWWRVAAGIAFVGYGLGMGVVTVTVTRHAADPYQAMATCGSSSLLVGIGLAVLAPWLLRVLVRPVTRMLGVTPAGHLAAYNATRRSVMLAGVLAPVLVLTAGAVGTLMLVGTDHRTMAAASQADRDAGRTVNLLNYVVTGMITLFAAIMVANAFAAVIAHRRAELQRLRLAGATRGQVERSVLAEGGLVAAVGVVLGTLASLATIIPFGIARHEGLVPNGELWLPPVVAAGIVVLTLASAGGAVRRATRPAALR